ncbi:hypothetical protein PRZ48_008878 [Zasmidium cellare]|uniref:Uncharacterized protein n=1 Tax=Zasmidium cellare TaxID=395010 RepID=A0ABR0EGQ4_ZASCE|nr:hypothetical protein PRZ48_008878 [Zasmidium cellare]
MSSTSSNHRWSAAERHFIFICFEEYILTFQEVATLYNYQFGTATWHPTAVRVRDEYVQRNDPTRAQMWRNEIIGPNWTAEQEQARDAARRSIAGAAAATGIALVRRDGEDAATATASTSASAGPSSRQGNGNTIAPSSTVAAAGNMALSGTAAASSSVPAATALAPMPPPTTPGNIDALLRTKLTLDAPNSYGGIPRQDIHRQGGHLLDLLDRLSGHEGHRRQHDPPIPQKDMVVQPTRGMPSLEEKDEDANDEDDDQDQEQDGGVPVGKEDGGLPVQKDDSEDSDFTPVQEESQESE